MSPFDQSTEMLDEPTKPKKVGGRLADFGDRLAKAFAATDRPALYVSERERDEDPYSAPELEQPWERIASRFPISREGYDRAAVDQYLSELERELVEARSSAVSEGSIATEIDRIGEQTTAILKTAHDQAQQITRRAKSEADHCIAQAASRAMEMTQTAEQRLRDLDGETDTIWSERAQLIDDVRSVASSLMTLAEESARRFPAETARTAAPAGVAAQGLMGDAPRARNVAAAQAPTIAASQPPMTAAPQTQPMTAAAQAPALAEPQPDEEVQTDRDDLELEDR